MNIQEKINNSSKVILELTEKLGKNISIEEYNNSRNIDETLSRQSIKYFTNMTFSEFKESLGLNTRYNYNNKIEILLNESLISYYWLGFLFADGSISQDFRVLNIRLAEKDYNHVCNFRNYIKYIGKQSKLNISVSNDSLKEISLKYQILPNKSHREDLDYTIFKNLQFDKWVSWFIGYTDGDGCIRKRPDRPNQYIISYVASKHNLNFHNELLKDVSNRIDSMNSKISFENDSIIRWRITKNSVVKILKQNSCNVPCLDRKWSKITII